MASSGKKGKKPKGKTIDLNTFLADGATGAPLPVIRSKPWSDEVENDDDMYDMGSRNKQPLVLPTAPRATRSPNVEDENIPRNPPFNAYISNLQYDLEEDEISEFFKDMKVVTVRLPRDDRGGGRLRGFGYVEFESRDSLIAALNIGDKTIKGRRIRIEIASNGDNERRRGGNRDGGYDMGRDRGDGPDRTLGDWRSGPRDESEGARGDRTDRADRGNFNRDNMDGPAKDRGSFTRDNMDGPPRGSFTRDNMDGPPRGSFTRDNMDGPPRGSFTRDNMDGPPRGSFTRDNMDGPPSRDRGSFTRDNMDGPPRGSFTRDNMDGPPARDRGSFTRDNMDGPRGSGSFSRDNMNGGLNHRRDGGGYDRGSNRGSGNRDDRGSGYRGGYGISGDGGNDRFNDRFNDRGDRGGSFGQRRDFRGDGDRGNGDYRSNKDDLEGLPSADVVVKERPKLNLARRTLPESPLTNDEPVAQGAIFGGAKPVDTAAREREIEERLAKQKEGSKIDSSSIVRSEEISKAKSVSSDSGTIEDEIKGKGEAMSALPPSENAWQRRAQLQNQVTAPDHAHVRVSPTTQASANPRRPYNDSGNDRGNDRGGRGGRSGSTRGGQVDRQNDRSAQRSHVLRGKGEIRPDERLHRKDHDDASRMPKLREQAAPNFLASNKYGILPREEDDTALSD